MLPKNRPLSSQSKLVKSLAILVGVLFIAATGLAGFRLGGGFTPDYDDMQAAKSIVTVPSDATVTAECEAARGKQYIQPKDIPNGPIYDVYQGKVVAVEYLVPPDELASTPAKFKDLGLPKGTYNHLSVIPTAAHAGMNENHFHVVAYFISQKEADTITCNGQSSTENMNMSM